MEDRIINNIKSLGIDMINEAGSGHPGILLGASNIIYTLYANHLNVNPSDPNWINRDRFILSCGHGSSMLYATLYLAGYDFYLEDLKRFRRIDSKTPGHPEIKTKGIDCTTGALGAGISTAVGMALASKKLNQMYKLQNNKPLFDYNVYVLCSDGDLMEGITNEALSLAGNLCLDNLIILYDSNSITIDGNTNITFNESICAKYEAMGFHTEITNNDVKNIDKAINKAKKTDKPSFIEVRTVIGQGSSLENTNKAHGTVLSYEDYTNLRKKLNIPDTYFYVDEEAKKYFNKQIMDRVSIKYNEWNKNIEEYNSNVVREFSIEDFNNDYKVDLSNYSWNLPNGLRSSNHYVMQELSNKFSRLIGGSADVASSTLVYLDNYKDIKKGDFEGRNIRYGVRENAMAAISNGLALSYFRPFCSCFLSFLDYMRPSIRMSAIMSLPVTYIFTHDSILVGQDGITHQPIEQLGDLRSIPNIYTFRPCDGNEVVGCWNYILNNKKTCAIILSRGNYDNVNASIKETNLGAYIIKKEKNKLNAVILSSGSEVHISIKIANELEEKGYGIRVVSVPCLELFQEQSNEYQESIIPKMVKCFVIEASNYLGWYKYVYNDNYLININSFGCSGLEDEVRDKMDFSYEDIKRRVSKML